jgi:hypothetical protein
MPWTASYCKHQVAVRYNSQRFDQESLAMYQFRLFAGEWLIRLANRQRIVIKTIEMSDSHIAPSFDPGCFGDEGSWRYVVPPWSLCYPPDSP